MVRPDGGGLLAPTVLVCTIVHHVIRAPVHTRAGFQVAGGRVLDEPQLAIVVVDDFEAATDNAVGFIVVADATPFGVAVVGARW